MDLDECEFVNFNSCQFLNSADLKPTNTQTLPAIARDIFFNNCIIDTCNMRSDNADRLFIKGCSIYNANFYFFNTSIVFEDNVVTQRDGFNYYNSVQTGSTTGGYITLISCHKVEVNNNKVIQRNTGHFKISL